jgi:transcriptional antiterminator RfaH
VGNVGGAFKEARRWFAVNSKPKREELAALQLERQGFCTYLPKLSVLQTTPRGGFARLAPFLPGYLFVRLDLGRDRWRSVNSTIGVSRLVQFGEFPAPAPAGLVERMIERTAKNGEIVFDEVFSLGDPVRLVGGPFDQMIGTFAARLPGERVVVLLDMLARETRVEVDPAYVTAR